MPPKADDEPVPLLQQGQRLAVLRVPFAIQWAGGTATIAWCRYEYAILPTKRVGGATRIA